MQRNAGTTRQACPDTSMDLRFDAGCGPRELAVCGGSIDGSTKEICGDGTWPLVGERYVFLDDEHRTYELGFLTIVAVKADVAPEM